MKNPVISLTNRKGGSGKTSIAVGLAGALAARRKRVLLVDLDPQADASRWLGCSDTGESLSRVLAGRKALADVIRPAEAGIDVAPAGEALALSLNRPAPGSLDRTLSDLGEGTYDCTILDCPPSFSRAVLEGWKASDFWLVPVEGPDAFRAVSRIGRALFDSNLDLDRLRVIRNRWDSRRVLDRELRRVAEERFSHCLLRSAIRETVVVRESAAHRQPLHIYAPAHAVTRDFDTLATEILNNG